MCKIKEENDRLKQIIQSICFRDSSGHIHNVWANNVNLKEKSVNLIELEEVIWSLNTNDKESINGDLTCTSYFKSTKNG